MVSSRDLDLIQRRDELTAIARIGIDAVRPTVCVGAAIDRSDRFWQGAADDGYLLLAFGKAAVEMARTTIEHLGSPIDGIVITHAHDRATVPSCSVREASHPVPDERSLRAGAAVFDLVSATRPEVPVVVLISGGASSLVEVARAGVTLDDLRLVNEALLRSGVPIAAMNTVRQALSEFKGGGLARMLAGRSTRTLIISDVVGNHPTAIASGPMSSPDWRRGDPWDLCPDELRARLPRTVEQLLRAGQPILVDDPPIAVVADAAVAARATLSAAVGRGHRGTILTTTLEGDASDRARWMLGQSGAGISICAGETTVQVVGDGVGGRNQHAALTWALEIDDPAAQFAGLAIGTDGRDGPTDAAGGLVDGTTASRIRAAGADPGALLANDDSNRGLDLAGDLVPAEPTGTNVGDLWIVARSPV